MCQAPGRRRSKSDRSSLEEPTRHKFRPLFRRLEYVRKCIICVRLLAHITHGLLLSRSTASLTALPLLSRSQRRRYVTGKARDGGRVWTSRIMDVGRPKAVEFLFEAENLLFQVHARSLFAFDKGKERLAVLGCKLGSVKRLAVGTRWKPLSCRRVDGSDCTRGP